MHPVLETALDLVGWVLFLLHSPLLAWLEFWYFLGAWFYVEHFGFPDHPLY